MPKRDSELYIQDIIESANAIKLYCENIDFETFCNDRKTYSATVREYTIIGEAVKFHHVVPFQKQYLETHLVKS